MVDYSERSIPLGRRFRALKLWFLLRAYGLEGLREMIRRHVAWAEALCARIGGERDFEVLTAPSLSLFSFRHAPAGVADLDAHNLALVEKINADGRIYLTQTRVDGMVAIRFQVGSFDCREEDVATAFDVIVDLARQA
jgi:aromatic-L-amino-acid decarboxylase